jgi:hypothetical protein
MGDAAGDVLALAALNALGFACHVLNSCRKSGKGADLPSV